MFDPGALLGSILQGRMRGPAPMGRLEHALGERGLGGPGGPLGQILSQLGLGGATGGATRPGTGHPGGGYAGTGQAGAGYPDAGLAGPGQPTGNPWATGRSTGAQPSGGGGGILGDLARMAERHLGVGGPSGGGHVGTGTGGGYGGPLGGGTGGGGLGGAFGGGGGTGGGLGGVLGSGAGRNLVLGGLGALAAAILARRTQGGGHAGGGLGGGFGGLSPNMRGAVGAGGLALLALLAMRALRGSGQGQAMGLASFGGTESVEDLPEAAVSPETATLVLRAMIEAAKSDGAIDATERQRITAKVQEGGADPDDLAFLERELAGPADPEGLAAQVRDPVVAAQVYAASLLAIEVDTPAERDHLRRLAGRLGLDPAVVAQLHEALGAPAP